MAQVPIGSIVGINTNPHMPGAVYIDPTGNLTPWPPALIPPPSMPSTHPSLLAMIAMRMHWAYETAYPFEFIQCHRADDENYYIFIVKDKQATIIKDGNLFPSDELITKLRLLAG